MSIQDTINQARLRKREILEKTYEDTCTVIEHRATKNAISKITEYTDVTVLSDQPCKLSFKNVSKASESDNVTAVTQVIKLFISPDVTINSGSKIEVTHNGATTSYKRSGIPAIYVTHQEIVLELFERWS